jgi:hypothetical protein
MLIQEPLNKALHGDHLMDRSSAENMVQETPVSISPKRRFMLFLATYFAGVIIETGVLTIPYINHPVARPDFTFFLERFVGTTLFLPMGVVVALEWILNIIGIHAELIRTEGPFPGPSSPLGLLVGLFDYLFIFIISLIGSLTRKQQTFRILYFTFLGLLIINIAGCSIG